MNILFIIEYPFWWEDAPFDMKILSLSCWVLPLRPFVSAYCHTFYCVNPTLFHRLWRLDFLSIVMFIVVFVIDLVYLMFYCNNSYVRSTLVFVWCAVAIPGMYICFFTNVAKLKDAIIGTFVAVSVLFLLGLQVVYLLTDKYNVVSFPFKIMIAWIVGPASVIIAVFFHATQFPEKMINYNIIANAKNKQLSLLGSLNNNDKNGDDNDEQRPKQNTFIATLDNDEKVEIIDSKINYIGGSHQIWHICINIMQFCLFMAIFWFAEYRFTQNTCM